MELSTVRCPVSGSENQRMYSSIAANALDQLDFVLEDNKY